VRRISRTEGVQSVGIGIRKQRGSNAVAVAHEVRKRMVEVQNQLPDHMKMAVNFDSTKFIEEAVHELNFTLLLSAILTALVCWLFLGSWSSTINVVLAIPTSMIGTFIVLYFSGFTLNTFTLLGLSLAIGIVVDDSIMVLENIVRHFEMGKNRVQAALDGAKEIQFAALAATIAVIAIFLPVVFMKGAIGKFFFQFGVTMTVAVALSLVEALTLTPMRCAQFLQKTERKTRLGRFVEQSFLESAAVYKRILTFALGHRWKVLTVSVLICGASVSIVKLLNKEFIPPQDQGRFMVRVQTPVGSSLDFTNEKFKIAEAELSKDPGIERYYVAVGGFGGGEVNSGMMFVTLKDLKLRKKNGDTQKVVMDRVRKVFSKIPETKAFVQDLSMRGFTASRGFPLEFTVRGPEWDEIAKNARVIMDRLSASGMVSDLDTDYKEGMPEVRVIPDRKKASMRGVSVAAIAELINATVGGVVAGKYSKGGHRYDIRVRLEAAERSSIENLKALFVRNNRGELISMADVVRVEEKPTLQVISRRDRERAISVFGNIATGKSQSLVLDEVQKIAKEVLPEGYRVVLTGGSESFKESFNSLVFALVLGLVVSYMVLASQFNSFVDPLTVLMALPFSISGAFVALWLAGQSLNIYSMIGLILLMGIVKKNSILLVDFTNQIRAKGKNVFEALIEACPNRLRPILMTSIATIVGAVPPALAIGPGAESRIPMAISVIGGVLVSTILTLFVVPCVYSLFATNRKIVNEDHIRY
ncbi:MAG TPA: efflux RND transporter permease subunit, partial [Oligoflexia bacterium]|nr:efflux RND transporter permease subunit [Oligoflexia bacterium]